MRPLSIELEGGTTGTTHSGTLRTLYDLQGLRVGEEEGDHADGE